MDSTVTGNPKTSYHILIHIDQYTTLFVRLVEEVETDDMRPEQCSVSEKTSYRQLGE
jgi:hypothetical protein